MRDTKLASLHPMVFHLILPHVYDSAQQQAMAEANAVL